MNEEQTQHVFQRVRAGDQDAAQEIFDRYFQRLIGLAHSRLSEKLGRKVDADDIVQSALRSFFVRSQEGQYAIERSGDLWKLLAAITRNKLLKQAEHFQQQKRSLDRDDALQSSAENQAVLFASEPTEAEAVALSDEVDFLIRDFDPLQQQMLELRLQGQTIPEIAETVERSERTVRRFLGEFRDQLEARLRSLQDD
ncbi:MAG: LuxR family transcriptional regulator [Gimesia sp.]|nr:LuxR family transcriptional regulator [Gimesia sp.]